MNNKIIAIAIGVAVVFGGGGFYGGTVYQNKKIETQRSQRGNNIANGGGNFQKGQGIQDGQRMGGQNQVGGFSDGEVISKDDKSITVKTRDGGSKIVYFSETTQIGKSVEGSVDDLSIGQQLMITGKTNSDGSLTANNIQIRPLRGENNN